MGTRKAPCYQLRMGTVQPAGNKKTWAAQGPTGLSREHPSHGLIPGTCHFWNCLFQDFLLCHLWFLRLPHHRKPQTLCSSPRGFLHLATLMSSSDTETRWKGLNVSLARCVDGISSVCSDSDIYQTNWTESPQLLTGCRATTYCSGIFFVLETGRSGMRVCNFFGCVSMLQFFSLVSPPYSK